MRLLRLLGGHIDRFSEIMFRTRIDELDTGAVIASDALFERLCRVISLTEQRGHRQAKNPARSSAGS